MAQPTRTLLWRGILGILFLAGGFAVVSSHAGQETAVELYKKGLRAFRAGETEQALILFRASEEADSSYPFPLFARARIFQEFFEQHHTGYTEAIGAYERLALVLDAAPPPVRHRDLYQAFYLMGTLSCRGGEYAKASAALERFLEIYPDFYNAHEVHNALGVARYHQGRYDEAEESFRTAIDLAPDFVEARVNLRSVFSRLRLYEEAQANYRVGQLDHALERVRLLREIATHYLPAMHLEASILEQLGRVDEAICLYEEVLASDPSHPETHGVRLDLARILELRGQPREALQVLNGNVRYFRDMPRDPTKRTMLRLLEVLRSAP